MLKKIKSSYFSKIIFSFVIENIKLKIVKYNKKLQKELTINITIYKHLLSRYIIYESDNKGKEYYQDGEILFEGGYLKGEKHGKGKEYYDNGKLVFEGEYLKGENMENEKNIIIMVN